jgi:enoyl-[acyl-carrier protein] reductase I
MSFMQNKRVLITGMISDRSIAYGIAQAMHREGAELAFTYQNEKIRARVEDLAAGFNAVAVLPCDVSSDAQIEALFSDLGQHWDGLDALVHSLAFAPRESLQGEFLDGMTRENFRIAQEVSAYSLPALAKAALPLLSGRNGSLLTLTYLGSERVIANYGMMGLAKASLESSVRYLAMDLGAKGIRVNAISAGPIRTLAASGISNFSRKLSAAEQNAPLRRNVTIAEVGNAAAFLCSDLASGITGEILFVDAGVNIVGLAAGAEN